MGFNLGQIGEYGTGVNGDVKIADGAYDKLNSYARVVGIDANTITLDTENALLGDYEKFRAGEEILVHCSATNGTTAENLGKYLVARITLVSGNVLTLDKTMFTVDLNYDYVQAVTVANFDCVTLSKDAVLTPPPYSPFKYHGGIVAVKCWDTFTFDGGSINLVDCGIPANRKNALRPLTTQETPAVGEGDLALYSGHENYQTADRLIMNAGDGVAFVVAKKLVCNEDSRIGNPNTHGAQFCRGASNSVGVRPSNITNIGGSTIFIAAETIDKFTPKILAKYRDINLFDGRGLCRCYIASNTKLRADEGLYAYDCISNPARLQQEIGVRDFGDGSFGDMENPTAPLNNYAHVVAIQQNGYRLKIAGETVQGLAPIKTGALALIQVVQKTANNITDAGKIAVAKILQRENDAITLSFPAPQVNLDKNLVQIISIPQFENLTINTNYDRTFKFGKRDGVTAIGGVCAIACNGTLNLTDGKINVEGKGGAAPYGKAGLNILSNAGCCDRLPIGEGHGSVFILAKDLIANDNTRIGATYSGAGTGGRLGGNNSDGSNQGGGYSGAEDEPEFSGSGGGYIGGGGFGGLGGSGMAGGTSTRGDFDATKVTGGYGSNGKSAGKFAGGNQGAHVFIVADSCTGLTLANISTGGEGGQAARAVDCGKNGAAGYGGGGAKGGSSGGGSGFAFVYANAVA